ncbi:hypothetical protein Scep_001827 [Stephania cephalantha]|uniref:Uncharacterized protein n=1 Tax=Stephania cephalantha TaxID=152367 RepID=A0AAP0L949_9MAGN
MMIADAHSEDSISLRSHKRDSDAQPMTCVYKVYKMVSSCIVHILDINNIDNTCFIKFTNKKELLVWTPPDKKKNCPYLASEGEIKPTHDMVLMEEEMVFIVKLGANREGLAGPRGLVLGNGCTTRDMWKPPLIGISSYLINLPAIPMETESPPR